MAFSDNVRNLRKDRKLTQKEAATAIGVTVRTWQNYEMGVCMPRTEKTVRRIADFFKVRLSDLLSPEDYYIINASERGGNKAARELRALLSELTALYSGGKLSEEDRDLVIKALNEVYWDSKEKALEKYGHKNINNNANKKTTKTATPKVNKKKKAGAQ